MIKKDKKKHFLRSCNCRYIYDINIYKIRTPKHIEKILQGRFSLNCEMRLAISYSILYVKYTYFYRMVLVGVISKLLKWRKSVYIS